jgi:DNA-binding MarR family transcriptional regulator
MVAKKSSRTSSPKQLRAPLTISRPELLVGGSDGHFRRLVHNLFAVGSRHEAIRAGHGARIGLTGIEYTFLVSIRHLEDEGDVSVRQLADHLHLSGPFATTMVGKLIGRGLVTKETDPTDRRRVCLKVTEQGHELLSELAPMQRQVNDVQFGSLSKPEFEMLLTLLDKLIESGDQAIALQSYLAMNSNETSGA